MKRSKALEVPLFCLCLIVLIAFPCSTTNEIFGKEENNTKPVLAVHVACQVASAIIPATFNASGFPPNINVKVLISTSGGLSGAYPESSQFDGLQNNTTTDSNGNTSGEFYIDTRKGGYEGYLFYIYVDANGDGTVDSTSGSVASSQIKCG